MAQFENGIFGPTPTTGKLLDGANFGSDGLSFAANQIGKAMSLREGNAFDQTFGAPLRKRKRREIAKELAAEGLTPSDGDAYWSRFRDRLTEEGDMEGAEKVEMRRQQAINTQLEQDKSRAQTGKLGAETEAINMANNYLPMKMRLEEDATRAEILNAQQTLSVRMAELQEKVRSNKATEGDQAMLREIQRAELGLRKQGLMLEEKELSIKAAEVPSAIAVNTAQAEKMDAEADATRLETRVNETLADSGVNPYKTGTVNQPGKVTTADIKQERKFLKSHFAKGGAFENLDRPGQEVLAKRVREYIEKKKATLKNKGAPAMSEGAMRQEALQEILADPTTIISKGWLGNSKVEAVPGLAEGQSSAISAADRIINYNQ